jgi:uncharacterized protein (DUF58 family)
VRTGPVRERFGVAGDLGFWLSVIVAIALCIVALAGPRARVSATRRASTDVVILLDGSASMYTRDVAPDRWRRSVRFLRAFSEALGWRGDRVALALFAHLRRAAGPPDQGSNALFFFLDHLATTRRSASKTTRRGTRTSRRGLRWGLRLIDKDEQLFGRSRNPKAFVVITDGQSWSGQSRNALASARSRNIPGLRGRHRYD